MIDPSPDVYEKAAEVIETRGWHQGSYVFPRECFATGRVCLAAALNVAVGLPPDGRSVEATADDRARQIAVHVAMASHLGQPVSTWNDDTSRRVDQVIAALRDFAASLKAGA